MLTSATGEFPHDHYVWDNSFYVDITVDGKPYIHHLWDSSLWEENEKLRPLSFADAKVCVICFSLMSPASLQHVQEKCLKLKNIVLVFLLYLLGLCKTSVMSQKNTIWCMLSESVLKKAKQWQKKIGSFDYVEVAAKEKRNLSLLFETAVRAFGQSSNNNSKSKEGGCLIAWAWSRGLQAHEKWERDKNGKNDFFFSFVCLGSKCNKLLAHGFPCYLAHGLSVMMDCAPATACVSSTTIISFTSLLWNITNVIEQHCHLPLVNWFHCIWLIDWPILFIGYFFWFLFFFFFWRELSCIIMCDTPGGQSLDYECLKMFLGQVCVINFGGSANYEGHVDKVGQNWIVLTDKKGVTQCFNTRHIYIIRKKVWSSR